jgi:hypothetical protein
LRSEVEDHQQKNSDQYDEISQYHTDFLYLKLSLKSLEVRVDTEMSPKIRTQFLADIDTWKAQWKHCTEQLRVRRLAKFSQDGSHEDESSSTRSWSSSRRRLYMSSVTGSPRLKSDSLTNLLSSPKSPRSPRTPTRSIYTSKRVVSTPIPVAFEKDTEPETHWAATPKLLPALIMEEDPSVDEVDEPTTDIPESDDEEDDEFEEEESPVAIQKSAWEQLWDDLADFAGIHDPN